MTAEEKGFLAAIEERPTDAAARGAFADWLEERGRPYEAALQRAAAGLSEVYFKIRRKSDGLFSEGPNQRDLWSTKGKMWRDLSKIRRHLSAFGRGGTYGGTPVADVEVLLVEVRLVIVATLPVSVQPNPKSLYRQSLTLTEPLGDPTDEK